MAIDRSAHETAYSFLATGPTQGDRVLVRCFHPLHSWVANPRDEKVKASRAAIAHDAPRCLICAATLILFACAPIAVTGEASADFGGYRPHYQGFGTKTRGGRGGTVYTVTNLNDSGPGSLRTALTASGPRVVIFEVSGTIQLQSRIEINNPFLTLAEQTAPSPGILIANHQLRVNTHDVVIQHVRVRLGDLASTTIEDCIWLRNSIANIVLDHVSLSWCKDEALGITAASGPQPREIAILDSLFSEVLDNPNGGQPNHSRGVLFFGSANGTMTMARNLLAHNDTRNPVVRGGWRAITLNNAFYNGNGTLLGANHGFSVYSCVVTDSTAPIEAVHIANVAAAGPSTRGAPLTIKLDDISSNCPESQFFFEGNVGQGNTGPTGSLQWAGVYTEATTESAVRINSRPPWCTAFGFVELPSSMVETYVRANAGAHPRDRDTIDSRIVGEVATRGGQIVDRMTCSTPCVPTFERSVPSLAMNTRLLTVPANPHDVADAVGRTVIELWLETLARAVEFKVPVAPLKLRLGMN